MGFTPNPRLKQELEAYLAPRLDQGAEAVAGILRQRLSRGPRSGVWYRGQPARSSRASDPPIEFLQEQSGDTVRAVKWEPTDNPLVKRVGIMDHPTMDDRTLLALEKGNRSGTLMGRYSVTRVKESEEAAIAVLRALAR